MSRVEMENEEENIFMENLYILKKLNWKITGVHGKHWDCNYSCLEPLSNARWDRLRLSELEQRSKKQKSKGAQQKETFFGSILTRFVVVSSISPFSPRSEYAASCFYFRLRLLNNSHPVFDTFALSYSLTHSLSYKLCRYLSSQPDIIQLSSIKCEPKQKQNIPQSVWLSINCQQSTEWNKQTNKQKFVLATLKILEAYKSNQKTNQKASWNLSWSSSN